MPLQLLLSLLLFLSVVGKSAVFWNCIQTYQPLQFDMLLLPFFTNLAILPLVYSHFSVSIFLHLFVFPTIIIPNIIWVLLCARCYVKCFMNIGAEVGRLGSGPSSVTQPFDLVKKLNLTDIVIYKIGIIIFQYLSCLYSLLWWLNDMFSKALHKM